MGSHLLADAWGAPPERLNDPAGIREAMCAAVEAGGATLIDLCVHQFSPHGVTATATLAESHATIHTWPEHGFFSADFFFCGSGDPHRALRVLHERMEATKVRVREIRRGMDEPVREPAPTLLWAEGRAEPAAGREGNRHGETERDDAAEPRGTGRPREKSFAAKRS